MDAIPSKLLDEELGIESAAGKIVEIPAGQQPADAGPAEQAQQAQQAQQDAQATEGQEAAGSQQAAQQAQHAGGNDGDFEEEEEGRVRLPLFTNKVTKLVQDLLQYKVCHHVCPHHYY